MKAVCQGGSTTVMYLLLLLKLSERCETPCGTGVFFAAEEKKKEAAPSSHQKVEPNSLYLLSVKV